NNVGIVKTVVRHCRLAETTFIRFDNAAIRNRINFDQPGSWIFFGKTGDSSYCRRTVNRGRYDTNLLSSGLGSTQRRNDMRIQFIPRYIGSVEFGAFQLGLVVQIKHGSLRGGIRTAIQTYGRWISFQQDGPPLTGTNQYALPLVTGCVEIGNTGSNFLRLNQIRHCFVYGCTVASRQRDSAYPETQCFQEVAAWCFGA